MEHKIDKQTCKKCNMLLELTMFHKNHLYVNGHRTSCKDCCKKYKKDNKEQFLKACHHTNLQPLWAKDNLSKSNKLPQELVIQEQLWV